MAYALRPDGLADVEVAPGRVIPMPVALAQQAGHTEAPSLFDPTRGALAFTGDTPQRGTGSVGNVPDVQAKAPDTAPAPPPRDVGTGGSGGRGSEDGDPGRQGTDSQGAGAPTPQAPASAFPTEPRVKTGEVPDPNETAMAARAGPQRSGPRLVKLSEGGDVRASFIRQPGQDVPEDVANLIRGDQFSEGAQQRAEAAGMSPEDVFLSQTAGTLQEDTHDATSAQVVAELQKANQARLANIRNEQEAIKRQELQRAQVDQQLRARQKLIADRDAEANKLTPQSAKEVWASKSTFQQVMAAIQMALGGWMQGLQGRANNPGYDMVMQGITQEVADQRARYDAAVAKGERARGDYADAIAIYGSPEAAALELSNRRLEAAAKLTEAQAANIGTLEYKQAAALQSQALRQEKAANLMKLHELENGKVVQENFQYQPPQYATVGGGGAVKPEHRALAVTLPDGSKVFARSADQAKKAQAEIRANAKVARAAARIQYLAQQPGSKTDPAKRGQLETAVTMLQLGLKEQEALGTLDKGSQEVLTTATGNPTALLDMSSGAKLKELEQRANQGIRDVIEYELQANPETLEPAALPAPSGTEFAE